MLWFEPFPWARWALVALVALFAGYLEFRPDASVEQPFAIVEIDPGDTIDSTNSEMRKVPIGLLDGAEPGSVARTQIDVGEPVLSGDVGDSSSNVPPGWWVVGVTLPNGALTGDEVRLVALDTGTEVEGVVAYPGSDDPFDAADGGVAVPSDVSKEVAMAAANGRLAVLISTG
ncbi:MAG: hypothetical protein WAL25_12155 [Acidimicrobiia bacterium]